MNSALPHFPFLHLVYPVVLALLLACSTPTPVSPAGELPGPRLHPAATPAAHAVALTLTQRVAVPATLSDPANATQLKSAYLFEGDHLHLNATGYEALGGAIDLTLFQ